jgi:hypothetical protein
MPLIGLAVSVTEDPLQIIPSLLVVPEVSAKLTVGDGSGFTVTEAEVEAEQALLKLVTVTEYEVVDDGETEMLSVEPPGEDHEYVTPLEGVVVSVTEVPLQIVPSLLLVPEVSAKLTVGLGNAFTDTVVDTDAKHAVVELVTVTV